MEGQRKRLRGIVTAHAYSVLQVHEAEGLRLVELRAQPKPLTSLRKLAGYRLSDRDQVS